MDRTLHLDHGPAPIRLKRLVATTVLWAALVVLASTPALSQDDAAPSFTDDELETIVGRIALYPDDLIGIILPASTYPLQIVQATRFLDEYEQDSSLEPDPEWDDSIVALLNYPEVLRQLDEDLDWTWDLGAAVLEDQARVLDAIQDFRGRAYAAGNLQTDDRQVVARSEGAIEIRPADPEVIYVPVYEPRRVVVYSPARVIHYHPWSYPVYYYPYPSGFTFGYSFRSGFFWGVTSAFSIGWHTHHVHVYHHEHVRHPYYSRRYVYTAPHFARRSVHVHVDVSRPRPVWRPSHRVGTRPRAVSVSRGSRVNEARTTATGGRVAGAERYTRSPAERERAGEALRPARAARPAATADAASRARQQSGNPSGARERQAAAQQRARGGAAREQSDALRPSRATRPETASGVNRTRDPARTVTRDGAAQRSSSGAPVRAPVEIGRNERSTRTEPRTRAAEPSRSNFTAPSAQRTRSAASGQPRARSTSPSRSSSDAPSRQRARSTAPSRSAPTRSAPSRAAPSRAAPSRAVPSRAVPTRSAPSRSTRSRSAPNRSAPSRSASRAAPTRSAARTRER